MVKYVVVIGDGMADYPLEELNNKTPLQASVIPNMDYIASNGISGLIKTIPDGMEPGSDVANLSIMGYNPKKYYTGRGPLEAASMGAKLKFGQVAFRCNFITEKDGLLQDFNANHISTEESKELINTLNQEFGHIGKFYLGVSYRNLFVFDNEDVKDLKSMPPHDIVGESIYENLLKPFDNDKADLLNNVMKESHELLKEHSVNKNRVKAGKNPANMIWLWGQGIKPSMPKFSHKYGLYGATITGVDLIKGLGVYLGLDNIDVPGATGYFDTDYGAKAEYAINALDSHDLVFIHVEAPDEAGHAGNIGEKIKAIESIDSKIVGKMLDELPRYDNYKIAILPDHATPIKVKTHTMDLVPYSMCSNNGIKDNVSQYNEFSAKMVSSDVIEGYEFMNKFLK